MVLQAFVDESYEDDIFVLAGYVATAEAWAEFSKEWDAALPLATTSKTGIARFKMREMASSPERMNNVPLFHDIINRHVKFSVAVALSKADLAEAINRIEIVGSDADPDEILSDFSDPYSIAFRHLVDELHKDRDRFEQVGLGDEQIDFYFDDHSKKGAILAGWDAYVRSRPPGSAKLYGATPRFEDDEVFLPLQAADFRAWWVRKWASENGIHDWVEGVRYPYKTNTPKIHNIYIVAGVSAIVEFIVSTLRQLLPQYVKISDRMPEPPVDPTPPVQRIAFGISRKLRSLFRR